MNTSKNTSLNDFDFKILAGFLGTPEDAIKFLPLISTQLSIRSISIENSIKNKNWKEFKYLIEGIYEVSRYGMKRLELISDKLYKTENFEEIDNVLLTELNTALNLASQALELEIKKP